MDKVFLRDLRIDTIIGIWEWERRATQIISLDLEMGTDIRRAAASDSIDDALNYRDVAKRLSEFIRESKFLLVEALAEAVAKIVITEFDVEWISVSVAKPGAIEGSREVGIAIERSKDDYA